MKVNSEEREDRYGIYPAIWVSGKDANPQNIQEWLYSNGYDGYKFCIVIDCMPSEFAEPDKETPVYFMDSIEDEIMEYIGEERVRGWLERRRHGEINY